MSVCVSLYGKIATFLVSALRALNLYFLCLVHS